VAEIVGRQNSLYPLPRIVYGRVGAGGQFGVVPKIGLPGVGSCLVWGWPSVFVRLRYRPPHKHLPRPVSETGESRSQMVSGR